MLQVYSISLVLLLSSFSVHASPLPDTRADNGTVVRRASINHAKPICHMGRKVGQKNKRHWLFRRDTTTLYHGTCENHVESITTGIKLSDGTVAQTSDFSYKEAFYLTNKPQYAYAYVRTMKRRDCVPVVIAYELDLTKLKEYKIPDGQKFYKGVNQNPVDVEFKKIVDEHDILIGHKKFNTPLMKKVGRKAGKAWDKEAKEDYSNLNELGLEFTQYVAVSETAIKALNDGQCSVIRSDSFKDAHIEAIAD